eukprot:TRINITY_DN4484_c0_g1_i2.p1 TRINITY_DN4484_c0_g1~~TRINITY_DN4484_c0_g1_i2.p1  ORF type:complete len:279 (+),score=43.18 TRINITY_DN4484_c0_g1_i2:70-906(+)
MRVLIPQPQLSRNELVCPDPSEYRPELKEMAEFRDYASSSRAELVRETYRQTKKKQWCSFSHTEMTIMEALSELNRLVDDSDPDVDVPNIVHAFQTAEQLRKFYPDQDWLHLTGLIHDLGKVLALWGEPQWCVVGDTFPLGCQFDSSIVFTEQLADNPDSCNPAYQSKLGIYSRHTGLDNVTMSWGHDEYLYQVLVHNQCRLPKEALAMIRYHSFYPWHTAGAYQHLASNEDACMLKWVQSLNRFDLYTKADATPDMDALKPYYQGLIDKYCPGVLQW